MKASGVFGNKMSEAVKVIVRCRPLNSREKNLNCKVVVDMQEERGICTIRKPGSREDQTPKQFTFDGAYYMDSTTEQIYNDIAYPLVEGVVEGYNGTVFAYGQTGCGKSFSMQGIEEPQTQRGIIPRAFQHIFESVSVAENTKYLVHASYLEIYNEEVRDLLSKNIKGNLEVKEHPDKGIYVKGLSMKLVGNVVECEKVMTAGWRNRSVGATLMNADSSRSHSIFTIYLEACDTGMDGGDHIRAGKLNLVDLAGSERQAKTGASGERLREATKINLSLSALGNVISALVDGKSKHIPYRDSKLTRLLQDSLGGNTKTLMVSCLSPADNNYEETLSTLRYANRAKNIKNKPTINEDPKDALLREYQEEIKKLRGLLAGQLGADGIKALLEGQSPSQIRIRSESRAEEATLRVGVSTSTSNSALRESEAEKAAVQARREKDEAIRLQKEYEEKLDQMKQQYKAEQRSNAKLQEDINKLKIQYEERLLHEGLTNQKVDTEVEKKTSEQEAKSLKTADGNLRVVETGPKMVEAGPKMVEVGPKSMSQSETSILTETKTSRERVLEDPASLEDQDEAKLIQQHEEALRRLQMLQQNMIGGEKSRDEELIKKRKSREQHVDRRIRQLAQATQNDEDDVIFDVYENMQDEVKARDRAINRHKKKNEALKMEIEDLNYEFERDRSEYLATIRRQERDARLIQAILNKIQPIIRRDCNYSNLDRIKKDASFDEDEDKWTLPDLVVMRTKLPSPTDKAIHSNSFKSSSSSERLLSNGMCNSASSGSSDSYNQVSCLSSISFLTIWTTEK